MRQLIIEVGDTFKNQSSARITQWVNEFHQRVVVSKDSDVSYTMHDVNQRLTGYAIKDAAERFGLGFKAMREQTLIVPVIDKRTDSLQPVVELLPSFFEQVLTSSDAIKIESTVVLRDGDTYFRSGNDELLEFKTDPANRTNDIVAAVVNFYINGEPGHAMLNMVELENLRKAYTETKFGGVDPLTKSEWDAIYIASVYRRMFSDESFSEAKLLLSDESMKLWKDAILMHNQFFKRQAEADNLVRDRFGKVIGRTFKKYDVMDVVKQEQAQKQVQTVSEGKVVSLEQKRTEKAEKAQEPIDEGTPFDDMEIFERALAGDFELVVDEGLQSELTDELSDDSSLDDDALYEDFDEDDVWSV